jgi:uncharacterized membrane protein YdjX (TVP38/TMEM64 family)
MISELESGFYVKKWLLVFMYVSCIILTLMNKDFILTWIQVKDNSDIVPLLGIATLLGLFPVIPYGVIAGIIGAKYGIIVGGFMNVIASTVAAYIMFVIARYAFAEAARRSISRYRNIDFFTKKFEANPFLAVLFARLIPIIPAPVVNIYSGISSIPSSVFLIATLVGKIPVMLVFAFVGDQFFSSLKNIVIIVTVYLIFLIVVFVIYRYGVKNKQNGSVKGKENEI